MWVNEGDLQTAMFQAVLPTLLFALCVVMMRAMARRTLPWSTPGSHTVGARARSGKPAIRLLDC
ncbi:hypothetical protein B5P44_07685 [Mycobacterium sp. CBMA 213]|nr:hypothetical protein [Mycolicibacterium sp. CBMA 213]